MEKPKKKRKTSQPKPEKPWTSEPIQASILTHLKRRELGQPGNNSALDNYVNQRAIKFIPYLLKEKQLKLGQLNKVFASEWLSDHEVVLGTKCNKLIVLNLFNGKQCSIPMLTSINPRLEDFPDMNSGIHSISINPSRSLLATGGDNPNSLAVYSLPSFDPICLGENCHKDWVFGTRWLDDEFVVTGSRDSTVALWRVDDKVINYSKHSGTSSQRYPYRPVDPCIRKQCSLGDKVRALEFNKKRKELATLTSNGYITFWDLVHFKQILTKELQKMQETVCVCLSEDHSLYAVGSQCHVSFLDPRQAKFVDTVSSREECSGVRSVNFRGEVLSVGTGKGVIMFFDMRKRRFLFDNNETDFHKILRLQMGEGWLSRDEVFYEFFSNESYPNAVYTHSFDASGTRLFAAGGPLPSGLSGNYAGLFQ